MEGENIHTGNQTKGSARNLSDTLDRKKRPSPLASAGWLATRRSKMVREAGDPGTPGGTGGASQEQDQR
jgi:hypothetical protein